MQPPFGVTKLTVDGCFKGNFGMTASGGNLCDHQGAVLAAFRSSLGCQTILVAIYKVGACCSVQLICA